MSETLLEPAIPCYDSVGEQREAGNRKLTGESPTYLRYGTPIHTEVEERLAELAGARPSETLIFNTGMSAVRAAIESGLSQVEPGQQAKIAFSRQLYTGTRRWLHEEAQSRGFAYKEFDASDYRHIERVVNKFNPDIILSETVGNYVDAPVLDYKSLLDIGREQHKQPLIVLDNTLPLSTVCDVYSATGEQDRACIVESGTKAYAFNNETLGLAYSKNPSVVQSLRAKRNDGNLPGIGSTRYIAELLPTKQEFDERNLVIFENTGRIALKLHEASLAADQKFIVDHPSLPTHENYAQPHVPNNGNVTPVIFVTPCVANGSGTLDFAKKIGDNPTVREHIQISDSFGFDQTAFYSADQGSYVRIAPGARTDTEALGDALYNALTR